MSAAINTVESNETPTTDNGTDPGFRATAKTALNPGVTKLVEALHELGIGISGVADDAAHRVRDTVVARTGTVGERASLATQVTRDKAGEALHQVETFVRERPFTSIGIALLTGYLLASARR